VPTSLLVLLAILAGVVLVWSLLGLKTSRPDGTYIKTHPYRRLMFFVMKSRNESVVYFEEEVRAEPLLDYLAKAKEAVGCDVTHIGVAACNIALAENPNMNRFVAGKRLYQRDKRWLTFSMKRKQLDKKAKLAVVKLPMLDGETFKQFTTRVNDKIGENRSGKKTYADKEFQLFNALPRPALQAFVPFFKVLDYFGVLPGSFIEGDGMYTSIFVANLGSLKMDAGFHHLYEWGNCPLFVMFGEVYEKPVVENGQIVVGKVMNIRFSFDERIDDGLTAGHGIKSFLRIMSAPEQFLGCLEPDESQHPAMWPRERSTSEQLAEIEAARG